uniref:CW-type domain-containing protein n=1 Tax=Hyaloperonospora arabidopsidis (strain Emoy2) TaxID=559515 RepID=M4BJS9_HYAAE
MDAIASSAREQLRINLIGRKISVVFFRQNVPGAFDLVLLKTTRKRRKCIPYTTSRNMWNVRLRGPRGKQVVLTIDPDAHFKTFSVRRGFPPRVIDVDGSALVKDVVVNNDTIVMDTSSTVVATEQGASGPAATTKRLTKKKRVDAKKKVAGKAPTGGVQTLKRPVSGTKKALSRRKIAGPGHQLGTSLDDESSATAEVEGGEKRDDERQRTYRRSRAINLTSKEDVETSLVNAVSGQSNDRKAKFFRAATKNAVEHQYELTLATARLNAALSHNFEVEELATSRRADGSAAILCVRFKETARKWKEETVDLLQKDELQAILKYVLLSGGETGREMLKPFNMAQVSTRVFWSIARLYDGDVAVGLADLVPDEDWSFLDIRTRLMSAKAMEAKANEEYYASWKQSRARGDGSISQQPERKQGTKRSRPGLADEQKSEVGKIDPDVDKKVKREAAESKCAQTTSALLEKEATPSTLRSAAAQAALSRYDRSSQTSAAVAAFLHEEGPTEECSRKQVVAGDGKEMVSEDEVEEAITVYCDSCRKARILSPDEAGKVELDNDPWNCSNLAKIGRRGGCDEVDDEVAQLTGASIATWLQKVAVTTRRELADTSVDSAMHSLVNPSDPSAPVVREKLEKLIDEARLDEINDWMAELVGETDLVQRLETQKLGTPADLVATPSDLVLEAASNTHTINMPIDMVSSWQTRAQKLVDEHPWLADWRTL